MLIFKIVPRAEWDAVGDAYRGSAHDQADGFLHFSTAAQLAATLTLYYAGRDDLMLVESMKMEIPVSASAAGKVRAILVKIDDVVAEGQIVAVLEA